MSLFTRAIHSFFGSRNDRLLKSLRKTVNEVNQFESRIQPLSDLQLRAKTAELRENLERGRPEESILPEAFAVVREAGRRFLGMRHFDEQLLGGMVLHQGRIAEMRTGEGKTLVATLPAYLNALTGKAVHVITVNDYLAKRDAEWMGEIFKALDLSVGVVLTGMDTKARQEAYDCSITYGTNNEFGFDYLRDNMAFSQGQQVQRDLSFAIVDEVDSILVDEARTPLIISGPSDDRSDLYVKINALVSTLTKEYEGHSGDYSVDEKSKQVYLTEQGHERIEGILVENGLINSEDTLYSTANISLMHHVNAAIRAHALFQKDVDYVVNSNQIIIVDEFTGRTMPGRRWSEGLHQAIEAKEGVDIQLENQTLASITYQNYFRLYSKLAGMTGTADTEAYEFQEIYSLEVVVLPTHKPMIRDDRGDLVFRTSKEKFDSIIDDVRDCIERKQPVLVGTASIETSEYLSKLLKKNNIKHEVLNAKFHEREAQIIANAGCPGMVTVATNMAGRGTDIVLGGSFEADLGRDAEGTEKEFSSGIGKEWETRHQDVIDAGGLHIIGTERHESRRIDNQLRGRAGRQGDPGSSRFYLSLEDNLMRIFASEKVSSLLQKLGMEEGEAIEHPWVTKAIENAQRKVEGRNFDIRKQLLEYDDVANDQRRHVYEQRNELMQADDIGENIHAIRDGVVNELIDNYLGEDGFVENWDLDGLESALRQEYALQVSVRSWVRDDSEIDDAEVRRRILEELEEVYLKKQEIVGEPALRDFEKGIMLQILDSHWKEHLGAMDHLRQGIHLRGFAQKNPKQEYKKEAFEMFSGMLTEITRDVIGLLSKVEVKQQSDVSVDRKAEKEGANYQYNSDHSTPGNTEPKVAGANNKGVSAGTFKRDGRKIGRNEPCPCGSGKKYKQCHGKVNKG